MIKLFRKIRYDTIGKNETGKYLKFAIGEILLVMIGILLALQVNNWSENRKSSIASKEIYNNLLQSLKQDSTELKRIIEIQLRSTQSRRKIISTEFEDLQDEFNDEEIDQLIENIYNGAASFFPRYGVYRSIISNNDIDLLKSSQIKALLIDLYDYKYKRYENGDAVVDQKFLFQIIPLLDKNIYKYQLESTSENSKLIKIVDPVLLNRHYLNLVAESKDVNTIAESGRELLLEVSKSINELIRLIQIELKK